MDFVRSVQQVEKGLRHQGLDGLCRPRRSMRRKRSIHGRRELTENKRMMAGSRFRVQAIIGRKKRTIVPPPSEKMAWA
ncbi:MAG: hypothetical protein N2441_04800 [Rhodocyclaceae bacterium]|nr:hypothetical protein [Rhodocyclaceae bacterium]